MEVVNIIKLIAELGVLVVIAGIFIYLSYRSSSNMTKFQNDLMNKLLLNFNHHPNSEESESLLLLNEKIYAEINYLNEALKADRSYVVLYHNGGKSASGLFFQKMSCICEVTASGILPMGNEFQNIHCASYSTMISQLREDGQILLSDIEEIESSEVFLYTQLKERHVYSVYLNALKDSFGNQVGFIGLDYCSLDDSERDNNEISKQLKIVGYKVTTLVDVREDVV